jgi:hypothetical protein
MAAVLPFLESEEFHFPEGLEDEPGISGLGAKGGKKKEEVEQTEEQILGASNVELTRLLWLRTAVKNALVGNTFSLVFQDRMLKIRLSEKVKRDAVPWANMSANQQNISFFSTNSKMRCPTFDLPAGSGLVGGTCPAAGPAQVTSIGRGDTGANILEEVDGRKVLRVYPDVVYSRARSVCASCYATGGSYGYASVQLSELVHQAVMEFAIKRGNEAMREALIQAIVWQIPNLPYDDYLVGKEPELDPEELAAKVKAQAEKAAKSGKAPPPPPLQPDEIRRIMGRYPNVIRIHSSGDFFEMDYARLWIEVARRLYAMYGKQYILWAPTRTQVLPTWVKFWATAGVPDNFVIRPSAYHVGDFAPGLPGLRGGTSVLTEPDSEASKGVKFDHQCGVYDLGKGDKTCVLANDPSGKQGCRACWVEPDMRVNYVAH